MKYTIQAHPWAKRTQVVPEQTLDGPIYHIYTHAKPIDGEANEAVIALMADFLGVKKYQLRLVSGVKSRKKVVERIM